MEYRVWLADIGRDVEIAVPYGVATDVFVYVGADIIRPQQGRDDVGIVPYIHTVNIMLALADPTPKRRAKGRFAWNGCL